MYLVDSNVFLNVLLYGEKFEDAKKFLNENSGQIETTLVNLMEIFSILTRKYKWKREDAINAIELIEEYCRILIPNEYDFMQAYQIQKKYILTSNDALILSIANKENAILITYDKELLKYDEIIAKVKKIEQ